MENAVDSPSVQFDESTTIASPNGTFDASRSDAGIADAVDGSPLTPRRKRAGRIAGDNTDETRARHAALYTYYKANPGFSQSKLAQWFTETYNTTMSQCSVSQILKKQKLAHGEVVEDPKPRPGKRKSVMKEDGDEDKIHKKGRPSLDGQSSNINGHNIPHPPMPLQSYPTPGSEARAVSGFQPVNSTQSIAFSHYQSPASAQATITPQDHHSQSRPPIPSTQPRYQPPAHHQAHFSQQSLPQTPVNQSLGSRRASVQPQRIGSERNDDAYPSIEDQLTAAANANTTASRDSIIAQLQTELNASRVTVNEYMKIVQKQESLIDNVLKNQQDDRERIRMLEAQCDKLRAENEMLREGTSDHTLKESLDTVRNLTRNLDKERERNQKLVELFNEEEMTFKEMISKRSQRFPLGLGDAR